MKKQLANSSWQLAQAFCRAVRLTLREIFDESAYSRFLALTKAERSRESYRAFLRDRESLMARKPRCC